MRQLGIALLNTLSNEGLATVKVIKKTKHSGRPAVIMKRYAQGSKEIVKVSKKKVVVVGSSKLLNERSVKDFQKAKNIMISHKVKVDDLQFLIGFDGGIVIADPLDVFVGNPPSNKNIKMINLLIEQARINIDNNEKKE